MTNMIDYIQWRGDLSFRQDPFCDVDGVIFSSLAYIRFVGRAVEHPDVPITLREAAEDVFAHAEWKTRGRHMKDMELLRTAAGSRRFGNVKLVFYREQSVPEEDTQFAAGTYLLDDDSLVLAFRGTDNTLVGWKEDFNMCFQQTIPSQRLALDYVREIYAEYGDAMRLVGHSKGGNLAVFAAARSSPMIQEWIIEVYSLDGPGFTDYMVGDPGYLAMVPRIRTILPQSSVIGMLMEHEEPLCFIRSNQIGGVLQHDPYSWEVMGRELVSAGALTPDAKYMSSTIRNWLVGMDLEERSQMVEALFRLLSMGDVEKAGDIFQAKNLRSYIKLLGEDEALRNVLLGKLEILVDAAWKSWKTKDTTGLEDGGIKSRLAREMTEQERKENADML